MHAAQAQAVSLQMTLDADVQWTPTLHAVHLHSDPSFLSPLHWWQLRRSRR
jgi:hypothetical protein